MFDESAHVFPASDTVRPHDQAYGTEDGRRRCSDLCRFGKNVQDAVDCHLIPSLGRVLYTRGNLHSLSSDTCRQNDAVCSSDERWFLYTIHDYFVFLFPKSRPGPPQKHAACVQHRFDPWVRPIPIVYSRLNNHVTDFVC